MFLSKKQSDCSRSRVCAITFYLESALWRCRESVFKVAWGMSRQCASSATVSLTDQDLYPYNSALGQCKRVEGLQVKIGPMAAISDSTHAGCPITCYMNYTLNSTNNSIRFRVTGNPLNNSLLFLQSAVECKRYSCIS